MKRVTLNIFFIFILLGQFTYANNKNDPNILVVDFLNELLFNQTENYYSIYQNDEYIHPDIAFPPGDRIQIHVVKDFEIVEIQEKILNMNLMEPKDEKIIIVSVLFNLHFDLEQEGIVSNQQVVINYYLSRSTGELKILHHSNTSWKLMLYDSVLIWLEQAQSKNAVMGKLYRAVKDY